MKTAKLNRMVNDTLKFYIFNRLTARNKLRRGIINFRRGGNNPIL